MVVANKDKGTLLGCRFFRKKNCRFQTPRSVADDRKSIIKMRGHTFQSAFHTPRADDNRKSYLFKGNPKINLTVTLLEKSTCNYLEN